MAALREINAQGHALFAPAVLFSEFPSLLRKLSTSGKLAKSESERLFDLFRRLPMEAVNATPALVERSWSLSIELNQGDTFDAMGYSVAERERAKFWTSDERFSNAAKARGYTALRYIP